MYVTTLSSIHTVQQVLVSLVRHIIAKLCSGTLSEYLPREAIALGRKPSSKSQQQQQQQQQAHVVAAETSLAAVWGLDYIFRLIVTSFQVCGCIITAAAAVMGDASLIDD